MACPTSAIRRTPGWYSPKPADTGGESEFRKIVPKSSGVTGGTVQSARHMKKIASILSIAILLSLFIFVIQNLSATQVTFLVWEWEMSLAVPIVGAYVFGGLSARRIYRLLSSQRKQRKLERKAQKKADANAKKSEATPGNGNPAP